MTARSKSFRRIGVGITTYLAILRRQIAKLSGRRLARFLQRLSARSLTGVWRYTVEAVKDGRVIGRRSGVGLNTNSWGSFLAGILSVPSNGTTTSAGVTTTSNSAATINLYNPGTGIPGFNTGNNSPTYVQLGTGTAAPTRADYNLQSPIPGTSNLSFSYTNGTNGFTQSASITYSTAQTPSELGLFLGWGGYATTYTVMLDHAVFTALPSATTFTVSYSLSLS